MFDRKRMDTGYSMRIREWFTRDSSGMIAMMDGGAPKAI